MENNRTAVTAAVRDALAEMDIAALVEINNTASKELNPSGTYDPEYVYRMDEFDKVCGQFDHTAYEAVRLVYFGDFNPLDAYFGVSHFDASFWSFSKLGDKNCPFDIDQLADCIVEHDNAFGNETIRAILKRMKNAYTPEQAERIEAVYHKLKYALDCLDDLANALSDVSGTAEDGIAAAKETNDPHANEYFTSFITASRDVNFARHDLLYALSVYNKHLGIHTDPSQYNR